MTKQMMQIADAEQDSNNFWKMANKYMATTKHSVPLERFRQPVHPTHIVSYAYYTRSNISKIKNEFNIFTFVRPCARAPVFFFSSLGFISTWFEKENCAKCTHIHFISVFPFPLPIRFNNIIKLAIAYMYVHLYIR